MRKKTALPVRANLANCLGDAHFAIQFADSLPDKELEEFRVEEDRRTVDFVKELLRIELVRGRLNGLVVKELEWLRETVPVEYRQSDELEQQLRFYVLEAIDLYNPNHASRAKFTTYLAGHLRMRAQNYQEYLWIRSSGNKRCRTIPIKRGKEGSHHDCGEYAIDGEQRKALTIRCSAEASATVRELIEALSMQARGYLKLLFDYEDQTALVDAFRSLHFRSKVSKKTGLSRRQVETLADEIRLKAPKHLLTA